MIDNRAIIADDAQIGKNVTIGANAIIGNGVKIGDNVLLCLTHIWNTAKLVTEH